MKPIAVAAGLSILVSFQNRPLAADIPTAPFDGRWAVVLECADTQDKTGFVKGYQYVFTVEVTDGRLQGRYGAEKAPASVVYTGRVAADGALELVATGHTGRPDYSVGKVAQGTLYSYSMAGRLDAAHGQAERRELRPCTATFTKL